MAVGIDNCRRVQPVFSQQAAYLWFVIPGVNNYRRAGWRTGKDVTIYL
jgi:hypothetical protein